MLGIEGLINANWLEGAPLETEILTPPMRQDSN